MKYLFIYKTVWIIINICLKLSDDVYHGGWKGTGSIYDKNIEDIYSDIVLFVGQPLKELLSN